jgi:hypothetical protein
MACQPAIHVGVFFKMTRDTLLHVPGFMRQALKILHLPVTFGTGYFAVNVALVIKQHVLGYIVEFYPGCWCVRIEILVLLFDPRVVGNNVVVAMQAFFYRRDAGVIGVSHIGMAILTLDLFHPAVDIVAEGNGLLRPNVAVRHLVKQENKHRNCQSGDQRGQNEYGIFTQGFDTSLSVLRL